jgi:hypothetical protein
MNVVSVPSIGDHTESKWTIAFFVARCVLATLVFGALVGVVWRLADLPQAVIAGFVGVTFASTVGAAICSEPGKRTGGLRARTHPVSKWAAASYELMDEDQEIRREGDIREMIQRLEAAEAENKAKIETLQKSANKTAADLRRTRTGLREAEADLERTRVELADARAGLADARQEIRAMQPQPKRRWAFRVLSTKGALFALGAGLMALLPA